MLDESANSWCGVCGRVYRGVHRLLLRDFTRGDIVRGICAGDDSDSPIIVACVGGAFGLSAALLGVRWEVADGYLKVQQWGIPRKINISEISAVSSMAGMRWKQGVGIRWIAAGEWAMLCGSDELVTVEYCGKRFIFSVDDAAAVQQAIADAAGGLRNE